MNCPKCKGTTRVRDCRLIEGGANMRRRRVCQSCSEAFSTVEIITPKGSQAQSVLNKLKITALMQAPHGRISVSDLLTKIVEIVNAN